MPQVDFKVDGLKELRSELRKIDAQKDLQKVNKKVVNDILVPPMRQKAAQPYTNLAGGVSRVGTRGVKAIRGTATQTKASVAIGTKSAPYLQGANFGSSGRYRQFGPVVKPDRFLYATIAEKGDDVKDAYLDELDKLTTGAFPKGRL